MTDEWRIQVWMSVEPPWNGDWRFVRHQARPAHAILLTTTNATEIDYVTLAEAAAIIKAKREVRPELLTRLIHADGKTIILGDLF